MVKNGFNSRAVHSGDLKIDGIGNVVTPIFENSTFEFNEDGTSGKYIYSRWGNPTIESLEDKYASLEESKYAFAFSSGMSAITSIIMGILKKGDKLLSINELYGQTFSFFAETLPLYGIDVDFISVRNLNDLKIDNRKYKAFYVESITNPLLEIPDIEKISKYCRENDIILIVDATFATPYNQNPLSLGADIVVHSGTKYLSGHTDLLIGLLGSNKYYDEIIKSRKTFGGIPDAFQAYLVYRGIKTLGLRMKQHNQNGKAVADILNDSHKIEAVYYPGLENGYFHNIAKRNLRGYGGMVSFKVRGGIEKSHKLINNMKIPLYAVSLGGVESLISIPVEGTHSALSKAEREESGITDNLIRLSLGIEDTEDLVQDVSSALEKL